MSVQVDKTSGNLPQYLTRFIGRSREIAQLKRLLTTGAGPRLITLTGLGGCGKTRLAAELACVVAKPGSQQAGVRLRDGVRWVELASLSDPARAPQAVAAALGLREATGSSPTRALVVALREAHVLLVLDNCEHLTAACGALARQLLAGCPNLVILATSRAPLNVAGESVFAVPPLQATETGGAGPHKSLPAPGEAVQLFLDRAAMVLSGYGLDSRNAGAISEICRRLDGLPLAIELAASWIRVLSAHDILQQVQQGLDLLSSSEPTLPRRHRSMRAVLDASWRSLTTEQQQILAALAVFRGSFSREAARVVAAASLPSLAALTDSSLLQRLPGGKDNTRYQLHEVVRQYTQDRLEAYGDGTDERARQQHLNFYLALAEQAAEAWDTEQETAWLRRLRVEQENLRAAVRRAIAQAQTEEALRLNAALFTFWIYTTPPEEYSELLSRALALPVDGGSPASMLARAKTLNVTGYAAVAKSDFPRAMAYFQEGLALYRQLGDERGISWSQRGCGYVSLLSGQVNEAKDYVDKSLALCRKSGDRWGEAWSIFDLGQIAFAQGAIERAQPLIEDGLQRFRQMGILFGAYRALILLGDIQRRAAEWEEAVTLYTEALELEQENRFGQFGADLLEGLAKLAAMGDRPSSAARLFGAGRAWRQTFGQARSFFHEPEYQRTLAAARARLADDDWSAEYEAGSELGSEQAMATARQEAQSLAVASPAPYPAGLTEREVEVLCLVAEGLKDQEIADQLVVSPRTVHAHLRSIYGKLEVGTRTAAAREALRLQLVPSRLPPRLPS